MTVALPSPGAAPVAGAPAAPPQARVLALPGLTEQILVILTTFIFMHRSPVLWFQTRSEQLESSDPLIVVAELALIAIAFARVAGSIDYLIEIIRLEPLVYVLAGMTFASMFWSDDPTETLKASVVFVAVTCFASYLIIRFSLDQIIRLLAVMFTISALLNLAFVLALPQFGIDNQGNWSGVFSQKNALGFTATVGIPTLIVAARSSRNLRLVFYPAAVVLAVLLAGSQSRTMLVATAIPVVLLPVYHLFRSRRTLRGAVLMSLVGSGLFAVAFTTANIALLASYLDKDVSLTGRVPLWQQLWPVIVERPLLGHGFGAAFGGFFSPVHEVWIQSRWNPSHAHNAIFQLWLEIGVFGMLAFVILYIRSVLRAIKIVAVVPGAVGLWPLAFLTTSLMVSITESGMTSNSLGWMMFVVAALSVSLHLRYRSNLGFTNDLRAINAARARGLDPDRLVGAGAGPGERSGDNPPTASPQPSLHS